MANSKKNHSEFLVTARVIFRGSPDLLDGPPQKIARVMRRLSRALATFSPTRGTCGETTTHYRKLDPARYNCFRCESCSRWSTLWCESDRIEGLAPGANVSNRYLCDDCLPPDAVQALIPPSSAVRSRSRAWLQTEVLRRLKPKSARKKPTATRRSA